LYSDAKVSPKGAKELLVNAVQEANLAIYQHNQTYQTNIGTTLAAALVVDTTILIANVGDSRTYLYCEHKGLTQVTQDHSYVAHLLASGQITLDEVYSHPRRNEIYRCLGEKPSVDVDTFMLPLEIGTTLLLCSDGLWEMVRDPDIAEILRTALPDPSRASWGLIQAALDGGGKDNVSAIVVHVT
jgi:serine/threonine protein phosphatase PrpC